PPGPTPPRTSRSNPTRPADPPTPSPPGDTTGISHRMAEDQLGRPHETARSQEKAPARRQVGIRKANVSESLMKCRNSICDIETGASAWPRDESGGGPVTGPGVSGMKAARD